MKLCDILALLLLNSGFVVLLRLWSVLMFIAQLSIKGYWVSVAWDAT